MSFDDVEWQVDTVARSSAASDNRLEPRRLSPDVVWRIHNSANPRSGKADVDRGSGSKAALVIRELVDTQPPRRLKEIAEATTLTVGAVSRLLDGLDEDGSVVRETNRIVHPGATCPQSEKDN